MGLLHDIGKRLVLAALFVSCPALVFANQTAENSAKVTPAKQSNKAFTLTYKVGGKTFVLSEALITTSKVEKAPKKDAVKREKRLRGPKVKVRRAVNPVEATF